MKDKAFPLRGRACAPSGLSQSSLSQAEPLVPNALRILELDKICKSQVGMTAAFRYALQLQEKGWMRFPAPEWNKPAILAFDGAECVAGINYSVDEDQLRADVEFAFCSPTHPMALTRVLLRFRSAIRKTASEQLCFTCHVGNAQMMKAVRLLKLTPTSQNYRMPLAAQPPNAGES